jgi:hypothetical protein
MGLAPLRRSEIRRKPMKQRFSAIFGLCAFVAMAAVGIAQNARVNGREEDS